MKLLVIGLDGLSLRVIRPWLDNGSLPALKSLMDAGTHGPLASTVPPLTPPAWYSSLTGLNPGRHNIFGFFKPPREKYAKVPISFSDLRAPCLWDHLGREGRSSIVLYLPVSYPPPDIRGVMISGFMTPEGAEDCSSPRGTAGEVAGAIPGFRLNLDHRNIRLGRLDEFYAEALEVLKVQSEAALYLMREKPWDLFFVHFHDIDSVTHIFWKDQDPSHPAHREGGPHGEKLEGYYRAVDREVGRLVEAAGEDTAVIVYSDHGFMPAYRFFNVNRWLMDRGLLGLKGSGMLGLKSTLSRLGLGREKLGHWARSLGLGGLSRRLPGRIKEAFPKTRFSFDSLSGHVDWKGTKAYFLSASEGSLYANIEGREPAGILPEKEAEGLLKYIRGALLEERDPGTGKPFVEEVFLKEEVYHGRYVEAAPDAILMPGEGYYFSEDAFGPLCGDQGLEKHQISATHHPEGAIILAGGPFREGGRLEGARIWDVTPTALHALGAPVPRGLDGRVLEDSLRPGCLAERPVEYGEEIQESPEEKSGGLAEGEMKRIISDLKDLGYY